MSNKKALISGGTIITVDNERRVIEDGAVFIDGDRIEAVQRRTRWRSIGY